MYLGIVKLGKHSVETFKIDIDGTADDASDLLSRYVYQNYNKNLPDDCKRFTGMVIDTDKLPVMTNNELNMEGK